MFCDDSIFQSSYAIMNDKPQRISYYIIILSSVEIPSITPTIREKVGTD